LKSAAIGAAVVASGIAATVALLEFAGHEDDRTLEVAAAPTPVPTPDPATQDGLTLSLVSIEADDTLTTVRVALQGRADLGRFGSPPVGLNDPRLPILEDQDGNAYAWRSLSAAGSRELVMTFDPIAATARKLSFTLRNAEFVNLAAEVPEGQRPPDPSATVAGPWVLSISGFTRRNSIEVPVEHDMRAFGPGFVVLDTVIQAPSGTVIRAHTVGVPADDLQGLLLFWKLTDVHGSVAALEGGGGTENQIEQRFSRTSGAVTLGLVQSVRPADVNAQIVVLTPTGTASPTASETAARQASRAATAARLARDYASVGPIIWTFTLPD
jgi:hypothetical protein